MGTHKESKPQKRKLFLKRIQCCLVAHLILPSAPEGPNCAGNEKSQKQFFLLLWLQLINAGKLGCPVPRLLSALGSLQAGTQLLCQLGDVRFFDDVQMAAGDFVDFDSAAGQGAPTFNQVK